MKINIKKIVVSLLLFPIPLVAQPSTELGAVPSEEQFPTIEFVFEERVTLSPATVIGNTAAGHRQFIPITGGTVAGPKLNGRVIPGGWDYQSGFEEGCGTMSVDYFLEADDGTVIRVLNESFNCGLRDENGERSFFRPRFEAPEGPYGWLTRGSFIATIEVDLSSMSESESGEPGVLGAIRIKFYQIK